MGELSKKQLSKYKDYIKMMRELRFDDYEIALKLEELEDLSGWTPITLSELKSMTESELKELKSYCWHDGRPRCDCIGIQDVVFTQSRYNPNGWDVNWSDENGDPSLDGYELDDVIDNIGSGDWNYGLYKKNK